MSENSLVPVGQSSRFSMPGMGQTVARMPPSPMVLQMLVQTLANLSAKVDALATRPPAEAPEQKVDRKTLWSIFD